MHAGDPAIKVRSHFRLISEAIDDLLDEQDFWSKLKAHLLPHIRNILAAEAPARANSTVIAPEAGANTLELDGIYFKNDRMYRHNIMRINYTTYNVRHSQDNINPRTDHRDIMLLASTDNDSEDHQFIYARVLGIFHVNVIYTGPGMIDYHAHRMEFLWVRWYDNLDDVPVQIYWSM